MDVTVVDITDVPSKVDCGDIVTLIGQDGNENISVDEVARLTVNRCINDESDAHIVFLSFSLQRSFPFASCTTHW